MRAVLGPVLGSLLRQYHVLLWPIGIVAAVATALGAVVDSLADQAIGSAWEHATGPVRWVVFVFGLVVTPMVLPRYLAHGVTRHTFTWAAALAGGLLAVLTSALLATGFLVERAVYAALEAAQAVAGEHLFTDPVQVHLVLLEYSLLTSAYLVAGWLVGSVYYRFGGWRGTSALPLTVAPVIVVEALLGARWFDLEPAIPDLPAVAVLLATATIGLALMALRLLTRTVPVPLGRTPAPR